MNDDDEPVGVIVLHSQPTSPLVVNDAVAPEAQALDIGRALIRLAEQRARDLGLTEVALYTNEKMTENLSLYPARIHRGYAAAGRRIQPRVLLASAWPDRTGKLFRLARQATRWSHHLGWRGNRTRSTRS